MAKMITTKHHKYKGEWRAVGDTYDALSNDIAALRKMQWAEIDKPKAKLLEKKVSGTAKAAGQAAEKSVDNTYQTKHLEAE